MLGRTRRVDEDWNGQRWDPRSRFLLEPAQTGVESGEMSDRLGERLGSWGKNHASLAQ